MHPDFRLVLAANRDEYYDRPTTPLAFWDDEPYILAGRDLRGNGTWLGVTKTGRIAAITNFRDPNSANDNATSRGLLISNYLAGKKSPESYLEHVKTIGHRYNGFNLLAGNEHGLFYYSNKATGIKKIKPGLYGLSNHLLNTPWPKVEKGKAALKTLLAGKKIDIKNIFNILRDSSYPPNNKLPDTGVDLDWERTLSSIFITSENYGTRSSSIVLWERTGRISFIERTFTPEGSETVAHNTRQCTLTLNEGKQN